MTAAAKTVRSARRHVGVSQVVGSLLGAALLAVTALRLDWSGVTRDIAHADALRLGGAVALSVPVVLVRSLRTRLLLRRLGGDVSMRRLCSTQLVGLTLSGITPGAAGDLSRAWMWRRGEGIPVRTGVAVVAVERVASLLMLVGVGAVLIAPAAQHGAWASAGIVAAGLVITATPWLPGIVRGHPTRLLTIARRAGARLGRGRRAEALRVTSRGILDILRAPGVAAGFVALSVTVFLLSGLQLVLVVSALGGGISPAGGAAVYALSQAAGSLSALPFGLGATEAAVVGLLVRLGQGADVAGATAILSRIVLTLPTTLAAVVALAFGSDTVGLRPPRTAVLLGDELGDPEAATT